MLRLLTALLLIVACLGSSGCDSDQSSQNTPSPSYSFVPGVPPWVKTEADLIVYRCGPPDHVLDTSWDNPRPLIVSRIVTYRKAHLKIFYVPSDPVNQPPPYHWKMMGLMDSRTNHPIAVGPEMEGALQKRLPCVLNNPK
jgi:hypothetical protein